jgi:lysophospholipase L1-like esterase
MLPDGLNYITSPSWHNPMNTLIRFGILFIGAATWLAPCWGQPSFQLSPDDRVVFFGDSITDQRLYTTFVETYVLTRFPQMNVTFVHSGWGGDRVTGGGGGGIQTRLERDVIAYHPTVVTVMLGMNDGRYRAFDDQIFRIYSDGYRNIVRQLKSALPGVSITAIQPSPYDDITRAPNFPGGYNAVLLRYSDYLAQLADSEHLTVADLNRPVTAMLERAKAANPALAQKILPDRVHPGPAGHLIMAEALLKAWHAPALVTDVELDASSRQATRTDNAALSAVQFGKTISWTETDRALPMAVDLNDPLLGLAVNSSDFMDALDRETLRVSGLAPGKYRLMIDGDEEGAFTAADLANGINLARIETPMWAQAARVHALTLKRAAMHNTRWRNVQVPMETEDPSTLRASLDSLDALEAELRNRQHEAARPEPHRFEIVPGDSSFQPIFDGRDLAGWHISQVNHHGNTQGWTATDGILTGTQDKPGNGGIVLTDRKYRDFEVSLDLNPDYGCDSGLFLRSTEKGEAYQVLIDYLDGGAVGGIYGEALKDVHGYVPPRWHEVWKNGQWNHLRARIEGDVPHIQVWLNGIKVTDWRDTANHLPNGATDGMIALQVHGGNRWIPGEKHRFRNIVVRELP